MLQPVRIQQELGAAETAKIIFQVEETTASLLPSSLEEAHRIFARLAAAVEAHPEAFQGGGNFTAIRVFKKAVERCGVTLGQLGTSEAALYSQILKATRRSAKR